MPTSFDYRDIPVFNIISSHRIASKTTRCLSTLYPEVPADAAEATSFPAVALKCRSKDASKAITIAEIVKRRVEERGDCWWQHTRLEKTEKRTVRERKGRMGKEGDEAVVGAGGAEAEKEKDVVDESSMVKEGEKERKPEIQEEGEEDPYAEQPPRPRVDVEKTVYLTIYITRKHLPQLEELLGKPQAGGEKPPPAPLPDGGAQKM